MYRGWLRVFGRSLTEVCGDCHAKSAPRARLHTAQRGSAKTTASNQRSMFLKVCIVPPVQHPQTTRAADWPVGAAPHLDAAARGRAGADRKSTRLNSSH